MILSSLFNVAPRFLRGSSQASALSAILLSLSKEIHLVHGCCCKSTLEIRVVAVETTAGQNLLLVLNLGRYHETTYHAAHTHAAKAQ